MIKKILIVLLVALVIIQFFHPAKNITAGEQTKALATAYSLPPDVKTILDKACMDCHSNNTRYPWYNNIQPVAWWLNNHIQEGKRELNFDEFASYQPKKQYHKIQGIAGQIKKGEMPLNSYTWIHKDAVLTDQEKAALTNWVSAVEQEIVAKTGYVPEPPKENKED